MIYNNAVGYVHNVLSHTLVEGDVAIDATIGNGWDTEFMAQQVGASGVVYGFDIQPVALDVTQLRVRGCQASIHLFLQGHESMLSHIAPRHIGHVKAITFNLGYLPGGDQQITTLAETTRKGLEQAQAALAVGGTITVVCYRHATGEVELQMVREVLAALPQRDYTVVEVDFVNQAGKPPVVFVATSQHPNSVNPST